MQHKTMRHPTLALAIVLSTIAAIAGLGLVAGSNASTNRIADGAYAVVVNNANSLSGDDASMMKTVKKIFLKDQTAWPGGVDSKPFDRPADSEAHNSFRDQVLGMSEAELSEHWIKLKQKTGDTPPREVASEAMLIKFVQKYEGAMGVVSSAKATAAGDKVKILFTFGG